MVKPAVAATVAALLVAAPGLPSRAQAPEGGLAEAFRASYATEAKADYADAIAALREGYASLYEQNLRLGWLYFLAKKYTQSVVYYQKTTE